VNKKFFITGVVIVGVCFALMLTFWYVQSHVKLVSKDERRAVVVSELNTALERYYDEHGRYPVVYTNDDLIRELSAKAYFENEVRIDVVQYVPINQGQTYELK
jgi:Tfp pilus assembly protein PilE